jgi:hypothetical protein
VEYKKPILNVEEEQMMMIFDLVYTQLMLHVEIMNFYVNDIFHQKMNKNELNKDFYVNKINISIIINLRKLLSKRAIKDDLGSLAIA